MKLLRIDEVAEVLGLRPATVYKMIREGRLPIVRPTGARAVRVREGDVQALIGATVATVSDAVRRG